MGKYREALNRIIKRSGISKNSLHNQGVIDRNILNTTLARVESPGVEAIDKYLKAFNASWHDWASVIDEIEKEEGGRQSVQKLGQVKKSRAGPSTQKPVLKKHA